MKNLITILIIIVVVIIGLSIGLNKQVKVDCKKAQYNLNHYNVPMSEDLKELCIDKGYLNK